MNEASKAVFLSYASQDTEAVQRICDALRSAGLEVWFDRNELRGGDAWDASIRKQIKECALFMPVISANTNARSEGYFRLEWKLAIDRSHLISDDQAFLLPVVIDDTPEAMARVPDRFRERQWSRLVGGETPATFAERVKGFLSGGAPVIAVSNVKPARRSPVSLVILIIVAAATAAGLYLFSHRSSSKAASTSSSETTSARSAAAASGPVPEKSIAVLPFDNLSDEKSNAYFAEGIQDEILTRLSKIAALKVISRSSTQKYKSAPDNLREVGRQLGVANLLEGSVQKIANAVHVNVQLIRVTTDEHLWAESYNRKLDDVFGVESEVASAIADQLNAKLTGAEQKAVSGKPTQNIEAYDAYLRGLAIEHNQYSYSAYQQAAAAHAKAVQLDPNFAIAWARLAALRSFLYFNGVDTNTNSAAAVKEAADHAFALQPDLGEAWIAQGAYRYRVLRDYSGGLQAYDEARKRLPNSSLVLRYLAYVERRLGRWKDAEVHYQRAAELDPRDIQILISIGGQFLNLLRRFAEAHAVFDRALAISPNDESVLSNKASLFQSEGRLDDAAKVLARIPADSTDEFVIGIRATQAMFERRFDDAIALNEKGSAPKPEALGNSAKGSLVLFGYCQEWAGRPNEARATFARAVKAIKPSSDLDLSSFLALAYAGLGEKEKALEQAKRAVSDFATDAVSKPNAETALAQIQARFGDFDSAIGALPHLLEVPAGISRADLRFNPMWDPLRKDPRFAKIIADPQYK